MSRPSSATLPSGRPVTRANPRRRHYAGSWDCALLPDFCPFRPGYPHDDDRPLPPGIAARPPTVPPIPGSPFLTANITSTAPIVAAAAAAAVAAASAGTMCAPNPPVATTPPTRTTSGEAPLAAHQQPRDLAERRDVNSPTPDGDLQLPLSHMVTAAASVLNTTPAVGIDLDFPALPAPGDEVMTPSAAGRRRAAKRAAPPEDTPPPSPATDGSSTIALDVEPASETRSEGDRDIDDPHLAAETALAIAASLGQDMDASAPPASTSRASALPAMAPRQGGSPLKRPRIDTGGALTATTAQPRSAASPMTREAVVNAVGHAHTAPVAHVPLPHVPLLPFPFPVHAPAPHYAPPPNAPNAAQQVVYDTLDGLPPNPGRHTTNPPPGGWQLRTGTEQPRVLRNLAPPPGGALEGDCCPRPVHPPPGTWGDHERCRYCPGHHSVYH
ncbi:hypothetical protein C8J57DRAFT_103301 [Mycena rebaudengoi]|nr:hypothetical protein C8J57DRAFT_103301 [Mycena rebaudengoi]